MATPVPDTEGKGAEALAAAETAFKLVLSNKKCLSFGEAQRLIALGSGIHVLSTQAANRCIMQSVGAERGLRKKTAKKTAK